MPNRLATQSSPYLRQHASDPVDWFAWGPEAFEAAVALDRPLFISIGYSACHWCHVMGRESFADPDTATVLNQLFVNVKVDREEHPDIDELYMTAVQATTGRGGWPMTVFALPDGRPFFAGTYFGRERTDAAPSLVELCLTVGDQWRSQRAALVEHADELTGVMSQSATLTPDEQPPAQSVVDDAVAALLEQFDPQCGGFGHAPKFPMAMALDLMLLVWDRTGDPAVLDAVTTTLNAIGAGGINDHIDGGFARYAVDRQWAIPHFEKMLYDQALLTQVFVHAYQATGDPAYTQVVGDTVSYVLDRLAQPGGGYAAAEDAETDGVEGGHYVWQAADFAATLTAGGFDAMEIEAASTWWGVTDEGNFNGANVLGRPRRDDLLRPATIDRARHILRAARLRRPRPTVDDKVLTEWNALWLSALAQAAAATATTTWATKAVELGSFMLAELRRHDGRWLRSWQVSPTGNTEARHLACAADYAAVVDAFTRLFELTGDTSWIGEARRAAGDMIDLFWDDTNGGLFTTGRDAELIITRSKHFTDATLPSANGLAATALARLGAITGDDDLTQRSQHICRLVGPLVVRHPTAFAQTLNGLEFMTRGPTEVVISGNRPDLVATVQQGFHPTAVVVWGAPFATPLWEGRSNDDPGRAYVCHNRVCDLPADTPLELSGQLQPRRPRHH